MSFDDVRIGVGFLRVVMNVHGPLSSACRVILCGTHEASARNLYVGLHVAILCLGPSERRGRRHE
jgi:hypothetical protein